MRVVPSEGGRTNGYSPSMLYSLGHSTLAIEEFLEVARPVEVIVDVRSFPSSRRYPHFSGKEMSRWLAKAGHGYEWLPALGGRRTKPQEAPTGGWQTDAFAAYAWSMSSREWLTAAEELVDRGKAGVNLGLLCAEALWWRCHRSLLSDYLIWRGLEVVSLRLGAAPEPHGRVAPARLERYDRAIIQAWEDWRARLTEA